MVGQTYQSQNKETLTGGVTESPMIFKVITLQLEESVEERILVKGGFLLRTNRS